MRESSIPRTSDTSDQEDLESIEPLDLKGALDFKLIPAHSDVERRDLLRYCSGSEKDSIEHILRHTCTRIIVLCDILWSRWEDKGGSTGDSRLYVLVRDS